MQTPQQILLLPSPMDIIVSNIIASCLYCGSNSKLISLDKDDEDGNNGQENNNKTCCQSLFVKYGTFFESSMHLMVLEDMSFCQRFLLISVACCQYVLCCPCYYVLRQTDKKWDMFIGAILFILYPFAWVIYEFILYLILMSSMEETIKIGTIYHYYRNGDNNENYTKLPSIIAFIWLVLRLVIGM